jgi:alpha-tubulin suppressor-like RCC1 family protein
LSGTVQAVANATYRTCAIVNGGAWCWGWNLNGELGDNSTTTRLSPVAVQGLGSGVQAITAGYSHSCALTNAGVKCWGDNSYGELGNNSTTNSLTPVPVQAL